MKSRTWELRLLEAAFIAAAISGTVAGRVTETSAGAGAAAARAELVVPGVAWAGVVAATLAGVGREPAPAAAAAATANEARPDTTWTKWLGHRNHSSLRRRSSKSTFTRLLQTWANRSTHCSRRCPLPSVCIWWRCSLSTVTNWSMFINDSVSSSNAKLHLHAKSACMLVGWRCIAKDWAKISVCAYGRGMLYVCVCGCVLWVCLCGLCVLWDGGGGGDGKEEEMNNF